MNRSNRMRRFGWQGAIVCGGLAVGWAQGGAMADQIESVDGVRMIHVPDPGLGVVFVQVLFEGGALMDPAGEEGLANLTARMLLRGTKTRTYQQIMDEVNNLGASLDATARKEVFGLYGDFMPRFLERYAEIVADVLAHPAFRSDEEFRREKALVLEDLVNIRNDDAELAQHFFARFLYRRHPLGRPTQGYLSTVSKIQARDCRTFYRRIARRGNLIIAIAGDVSAEDARRFVRTVAAAVPDGRVEPPKLPGPPKRSGIRVLIVDKPERSQTQVILGHPSLGWRDPDLFPVLVGNTAFGGTFTSRLMQEIREKRGWSYGVSSQVTGGREFGTLAIRFFPASRDTPAAIALARDLIRAVASEGLREDEVAFARNHLAHQFPFRIETAAKRADEILATLIYGRPPDFLDSYVRRVQEQTTDAVNRAMARWFDPDNLVIVVVGTASELQEPLRAMPGVREVRVHPYDRDRL